jgi:hypothetical protein
MHKASRCTALVVLVAAALVASVVGAPPVHANPTGAVEVLATTPVDRTVEKQAVAVCPPEKRVIGGGARTRNAPAFGVRLVQMLPIHDAAGDRYVAVAHADSGVTQPWLLQAWAICADPVPGLEIVPVAVFKTVAASLSVSAACPDDSALIGMGGATSAAGYTQLTVVAPTDAGGAESGNNTRAVGVAVTGQAVASGGRWQVTAYAVCVDRIYASTVGRAVVDQAGESHVVELQCARVTSSLRWVSSVGFAQSGVTSSPYAYVDSAMPWAGSPPRSVYVAAHWPAPPATSAWSLTGYALCNR